MQTKYLFVTGGVCSSLGKGLTAASIGMLLERKGLKIAMLKLDPYLNVDPGTMSPYQHGEVYVTDDGAETDLDLGHYYRFTNSPLSRASNATSGQIYHTVIKRERHGDYLGKTVQVIPHITDEIKQRILQCARQEEDIDVLIVEIGGTTGDIESLPFLEAIRQFESEHPQDCMNIHLTYVPYIKAAGEFKSKPSQHSVQWLRSIGLFPHIMVCRCEHSLPEESKDKISLFCNVPREAVIEEVDVAHSIYEVPLELHHQKIDQMICQRLALPDREIDLSDWGRIVETIKQPKGTLNIAVVGKYVQHKDAYKSVFEALDHAANSAGYLLEVTPFESDKIVEQGDLVNDVKQFHGYLVPGGFGERGWLGKILTARYCRENKVPYFGICLGMQVMVVEFARNVLHLTEANSTEIDQATPDPVISLLSEQQQVIDMGGTMRLGTFACKIKSGSKAHRAYGCELIHERHRHRFEFNNKYRTALEKAGLTVSGLLDDLSLCEIVEIEAERHPWMLGVQFHPEFQSRPLAPHPLFKAFVEAVIEHKTHG